MPQSRRVRALPRPPLCPVPREIERTGEFDHGLTPVATTIDASLPPEGYTLRVAADGISIGHADAAGERHARQTLDALRDPSSGHFEGAIVRDWPDLAVRGFMLDVSRDRVPTRETLEWLV